MKIYFTIPVNWVKDLVWDNHINLSLNKTQFYRCYYTLNDSAWINGVPIENFEPNFCAPIGDTFPARENCFICRLAFYSGK